MLLVFAGGKPPEGTWLILSRFGAAYYFLHFLVVLPVVGRLETPLPLPTSIRRPVLRPSRGGSRSEISQQAGHDDDNDNDSSKRPDQ